MKTNFIKISAAGVLAVLFSFTFVQRKTKLYIIGDSTAANKEEKYIRKRVGE
jgi:hypothetical protein